MATFRFDHVVAGRVLAWTVLMSTYVWSLNAQINPEAFRRTIDGAPVDLYTLKNKNGLEATITNYGGIVVSLTGLTKLANSAMWCSGTIR